MDINPIIVKPEVSVDIPIVKPELIQLSVQPVIQKIVSQDDLNCLAKTIYYEARGESRKGKEAVGFVIINRTKNTKFPSTVCGVVKETTIINHTAFCQFSWYCDNGIYKLKNVMHNETYEECLNVAQAILTGSIDNFIPNAISFHVSSISNARWSKRGMTEVAHIGKHIFYKDHI
jgi:spore germination cell wall hydrolase CwlJ-like protein